MIRVMFDTNAYDAIMEHGDMERILELINNKAIAIVTTHVQKDELLKNPNKQRRMSLLDIYYRLNSNNTPTAASLWGISKWGQAKWTGEDQKASLNEVKRNRLSFSEDDLIGITAKDHCDILITHDKDLTARLKEAAPQLRVLSYMDFRRKYLE